MQHSGRMVQTTACSLCLQCAPIRVHRHWTALLLSFLLTSSSPVGLGCPLALWSQITDTWRKAIWNWQQLLPGNRQPPSLREGFSKILPTWKSMSSVPTSPRTETHESAAVGTFLCPCSLVPLCMLVLTHFWKFELSPCCPPECATVDWFISWPSAACSVAAFSRTVGLHCPPASDRPHWGLP